MEVTLASSTDTNLGHDHTKLYKDVYEIEVFWITFLMNCLDPDKC